MPRKSNKIDEEVNMKKFPIFADQCTWLGCDEIWDGEKDSTFWFCSHDNNLDGACHQKLCPLLGEENELKNE